MGVFLGESIFGLFGHLMKVPWSAAKEKGWWDHCWHSALFDLVEFFFAKSLLSQLTNFCAEKIQLNIANTRPLLLKTLGPSNYSL